jgi:anti-sigma factor RsiW
VPSAEEEPVESHLLACDRCGDLLRETIALSDALRALAQSGSLRVVVTDQLVERARQVGRRVREYAFGPGQAVPCTIAVDDDLLVAHLAADLSGATRIDLSLCDAQGVERQRMTDIPFRSEAAGVIYQESITFAKASPSTTMIARLLAIDTGGAERLVGEYTFHHTRTIPGPPGWESM